WPRDWSSDVCSSDLGYVGLHPPDVAMMIGPQHIDRPSEAALVLLPVIRDVGQQIGVRAIGLAEHPVLVVAERRGPEPQRAILLEIGRASGRGGGWR